MKKGLLILVHGSKSKEADVMTQELVKKLQEKERTAFLEIGYGALQISSPTAEEGIRDLIEKGMEEIIVVPMFLFEGVHIKSDVPALMESIKDKYPQVKIKLGKHIGADNRLVDIIHERALETLVS